MKHPCPVCGYPDLAEPPRRRSGSGSYEVCPSCGFQFGVTDDDARLSYEQWRERWIKGGLRWASRSVPQPDDWDPRPQLAKVSKAGPKKAARRPRSGP